MENNFDHIYAKNPFSVCIKNHKNWNLICKSFGYAEIFTEPLSTVLFIIINEQLTHKKIRLYYFKKLFKIIQKIFEKWNYFVWFIYDLRLFILSGLNIERYPSMNTCMLNRNSSAFRKFHLWLCVSCCLTARYRSRVSWNVRRFVEIDPH